MQKVGNVHDFVSEMVVGTWMAFKSGDATTTARLSWVSPLRSKYIFTSREQSRAIVLTPEELAWRLGAGKATLVVEPVPLFDRAVSAALDSSPRKKRRRERRSPPDATAASPRRGAAPVRIQNGEQNETAFGPVPSGTHLRLIIARRTDRSTV